MFGPGAVTWRRLRALVAHLPSDGAFGRRDGWTATELFQAATVETQKAMVEMQRATVELLDSLRRITLTANGAGSLPDPVRIEHPTAMRPPGPPSRPARRQATVGEVNAMFAAGFGGR